MKRLFVVGIIAALVLVGVAAVGLPALAASPNPIQSAAPAVSPIDTVPATCVACFPAPCDCFPDC